MVSRQSSQIVAWLTFAVMLLAQTAAVGAFIYGTHIRVLTLEEELRFSRADRVLLHKELEQLPVLKVTLDTMATDLQEVRQFLHQFVKEPGGIKP